MGKVENMRGSEARNSSPSSPPATATIAITAVMTGFVFVVTYFLSSPIPSLGGQAVFDAGDIAVFVSALTFGPVVGSIAGGVGSALSDAAYGSFYAPFTFVVKGTEGFLAGYIAFRFLVARRDFIGWAAGASAMVLGYFVTNWFLLSLIYGANSNAGQAAGLTVALGEAPFDTIQVLAGGLIGLPVSRRLRATLPAQFLTGKR